MTCSFGIRQATLPMSFRIFDVWLKAPALRGRFIGVRIPAFIFKKRMFFALMIVQKPERVTQLHSEGSKPKGQIKTTQHWLFFLNSGDLGWGRRKMRDWFMIFNIWSWQYWISQSRGWGMWCYTSNLGTVVQWLLMSLCFHMFQMCLLALPYQLFQ